MSLIDIPPDFGSLFTGVGILVILLVVAYWAWQYGVLLRISVETLSKRMLLQDVLLDRVAEKRGIDLNREMRRREIMSSRSFTKKIDKEIMSEFFQEKDKGK